MKEELVLKLFFENQTIIKETNDEFKELVDDFFNYDFDLIIKKLNNLSARTPFQSVMLIKAYYYRCDFAKTKEALKNTTQVPKNIQELLHIEQLLLKRKVQELSGYSRLSNEISRMTFKLMSSECVLTKSIAKTFIGDNYSLGDDFNSAMASYLEAIEYQPDNIRAKIGCAKSLYYLERYEEARTILHDLNKSFNNSSIKKYLGKICKKESDFTTAIAYLKETVEKDPHYIDAYFDLFDIYRKTKDNSKAIDIIEYLESNFPHFVDVLEFRYFKAISFYLKDDYQNAIIILKELSEHKYQNPYTLYLTGKLLSKQGVSTSNEKLRNTILKEAQDYFKIAIKDYESELELLKEAPEINKSIISKLTDYLSKCKYSSAITLSHLDKYEESLKILRDLLSNEKDNYYLIKSIAIGLTQYQKYEEAITYFESAIQYFDNDDVKIYPNSKAALLREYAYCLLKIGRFEDGKYWTEQALGIYPKDYKIHLTLGEIYYHLKEYSKAKNYTEYYLEKDEGQKYADLAKENLRLIKYAEKGLFPNEWELKRKTVIEKFNGNGIKGDDIQNAEDRFHKAINKPRTIKKNQSILLILRKWNSYTPILNTSNSKGGGYFICHNGQGLVIDPGLNFLENFFYMGLSLRDINHIFISHAHNDHMADLESIITLLYKYNSNPGNKKKTHKVNLYMNVGSYKKFITNINLKDKTSVESVTVLNPETTVEVCDGITLENIRAKHDEILSDSYCLSFNFKLNNRTVTFTNDTGYEDSYGLKIKECNPDVLIAHIGTIKKSEFKDQDYYEKHLGLNGIMRILSISEASFNIISEFGEELKHYRGIIAQSLAEVFNKTVIPGDIGIKININDLTIKESFPSDYPPEENISKMKYLKPEQLKATEYHNNIFVYNREISHPDKYFAEAADKPDIYLKHTDN
ncbi:tetratricopeptide repeat protein [uncultured Draconibacterium sp.]|uniref:tetratricopeptide repeat protein n=1 Tax=uncultured Draconibacterium sp. TaxID=1573823 RepID=UPI0032176DC7